MPILYLLITLLAPCQPAKTGPDSECGCCSMGPAGECRCWGWRDKHGVCSCAPCWRLKL